METIAKKSLGLVLVYLLGVFLSAVGAAFLFFRIIEDDSADSIIEFIIFLFIFIFFVIKVIIIIKQPYDIITYEDGVLRFADGLQCTPAELQQVHYRRHTGGRGGWLQYSAGTLIVTVNGDEYKYRNISEVVEVQDRLIELMRQSDK